MLRVQLFRHSKRALYVSKKSDYVASSTGDLSNRQFATAQEVDDKPHGPHQPFFTSKVKQAWMNEELLTFHMISSKWWSGILAWSSFSWIIWSNFLLFIALILITDEKENSKIFIPPEITSVKGSTVHDMMLQVMKTREFLEEQCYNKILTSRQQLLDAKEWFKMYSLGLLSCCFLYNFQMGSMLGLSPGQNAILSFKRLLRRRGFFWHGFALGYVYLAFATVYAYYDTYIMTPQIRGLSAFDSSGRDLISAYGGKGLALMRIISQYVPNDTSYPILDDEKLLLLAEKVALHTKVEKITTSLLPIRSPLFTNNWGLKYRSAEFNDEIPQRCWFKNPELAGDYAVVATKQVEKDRKKLERKAIRAKSSENIKISKTSQKPKKINTGRPAEEGNSKAEEPSRFQVGKSFGSCTKDERFLKASTLEINKALIARLKIVEMLAAMNNITREIRESNSAMVSFGKVFDYLTIVGQFRELKQHIKGIEDHVTTNDNEFCLCHYYPFYGGYFAP